MLPTAWLLFSALRSYKWLFLLFTCHCMPDGRLALATRLTRTRFADDNLRSNFGQSTDGQSPTTTFLLERPLYSQTDDQHHFNSHHHQFDTPPTYRSMDKRFEHFDHHQASFSPPPPPPPSTSTFHRVLRQAFKNSAEGNSASDSEVYAAEGGRNGNGNNGNGNVLFGAPTCSAPDSRTGLCYEATECSERGGIPMGRCAVGGGAGSVCCLFEASCGGAVSERHAYFRNPEFPRSTDESALCRLKVHKPSFGLLPNSGRNICQLKLSFLEFDIAKPVEGNCSQDVFSVSGQNENNIVPRICGYNSGQHFYIAIDESGLVNLQLVLRGAYARKFDIHIQQIECGSPLMAPPHCLQYYDSTQGQIKSFNYQPAKNADEESADREAGGGSPGNDGYPNNIDYLICIRKETGFCSVSYEFMADAASGAVLPFSVGGALSTSSESVGVRGRGGQSRIAPSSSLPLTIVHSTDCTDDFLVIGGMRVCSKLLTTGGNGRSGNSPASTTPTEESGADNNQQEHVTIGSSSTTSTASATSSSSAGDLTTADAAGNGTRNGELHEMLDESSLQFPASGGAGGGEQTVQQDSSSPLRRPHRRADYTAAAVAADQPDPHQYFFSDPARLGPSRTRANKRNTVAPAAAAAANHLMAIDSTPGPFQLRFVSNGVNNARGFYLAYRQNPCRF